MPLLLVGFLVLGSQWQQSIDQVTAQKAELASQKAELAFRQEQVLALETHVRALEAQVTALKERWFGSPALWQPPPLANTDFEFFEVTGTTQQELSNSLNQSSICSNRRWGPGCLPDPAYPSTSAWGLAGLQPSGYTCYSPSTTTIAWRTLVVLPRWSPPADGSMKIPLVERWNSLAQVIYTHEAGHVAIDNEAMTALNDQAHHLPSCQSLIRFWADSSLFDNLHAEQNAYHARLRADCRPEVGCIPSGWLGWSG